MMFFFFKQKTAYEMRISDWSSDVCSSDLADHVGFWAGLAKKELAWQTPFTQSLDDSHAPNYRWFADGKLNVSVNCLDRHLGAKGDKIAIRFEGEKGDTRNYTYRELHAEVCRVANALKSLGELGRAHV